MPRSPSRRSVRDHPGAVTGFVTATVTAQDHSSRRSRRAWDAVRAPRQSCAHRPALLADRLTGTHVRTGEPDAGRVRCLHQHKSASRTNKVWEAPRLAVAGLSRQPLMCSSYPLKKPNRPTARASVSDVPLAATMGSLASAACKARAGLTVISSRVETARLRGAAQHDAGQVTEFGCQRVTGDQHRLSLGAVQGAGWRYAVYR
jgi:hypothetical protein